MSRELIWPPSLRISSIDRQIIGNAGVSRSPLSGVSTTVDRSGDRWGISVTIENLSDRASYAERANATAFLAAIRNRNARVWIHDPSYVQRGSFSAPELFTNADFSNGTTGWAAQVANLSVVDRTMRITATRSAAGGPGFYGSVTVEQYKPVVVRAFHGARSRAGANVGIAWSGASFYAVDRAGLQAAPFLPTGTSAALYPVVYDGGGGTIVLAGDWIECPFASASRCGLVDNSPNLLLYSDQINDASWAKTEATVSANADTAPDRTSTADRLIPSTNSSASHQALQTITVPTAAGDYTATVDVKAGGYNYIYLSLYTASSTATQMFRLDTGVLGSTGAASGNWSNRRASIRSLGDGWYRCSITAEKASSVTSIGHRISVFSVDSTSAYAGDGTSHVKLWRAGIAPSSVPFAAAQTTGAATTGALQTGSGLYLKGLPVSTAGLARAGDWCQVGNQLFLITAPLDSDAAGLGYLEVSPKIRTPFVDNEPVIFNKPMGRYMLTDDSAGYSTRAGNLSSMTLSFEEALD